MELVGRDVAQGLRFPKGPVWPRPGLALHGKTG